MTNCKCKVPKVGLNFEPTKDIKNPIVLRCKSCGGLFKEKLR